MFFPLKDLNPTERFPFVTIGLIALNIVVFLYELSLGPRLGAFVAAFGMIPYEITHASDLIGYDTQIRIEHQAGPPFVHLTLLTSMFIHGGFLHILGNMLYLWIFGNNIEDLLGPVKFIVFYLLCGLAAGATHIVMHPASVVPTVGASGAVAGVLGAYLIIHPRARVLTLVFLGIFIRMMVLPAGVLLVFWFVIQMFSGFTSISTGVRGGGVAWFAHIGGFIAGVILVLLLTGGRRRRSR
ncbi:MAG: rhomboid family intramembrane serine protease [Candidatus Latescibacterota bacterium]|nr:MAG: rhomboid family intramembrane serine protease [Candidatus Latescibacterota bacterium]